MKRTRYTDEHIAFALHQGLVDGEQVDRMIAGSGERVGLEVGPDPAIAVLVGALAPGPVHQDAAHGLGGCGEEAAAAVSPGHRQSHEVTQVDQLRRVGIRRPETAQGRVKTA